MLPATIIMTIALAGAALLWVLYAVEGFRLSLWQGILVVVVPFYVLYFAYLRSVKQAAYRWVLLTCMLALLVASTARVWLINSAA